MFSNFKERLPLAGERLQTLAHEEFNRIFGEASPSPIRADDAQDSDYDSAANELVEVDSPAGSEENDFFMEITDDDCIYIDEGDADHDKFDDCEGLIESNGCDGRQRSILILIQENLQKGCIGNVLIV